MITMLITLDNAEQFLCNSYVSKINMEYGGDYGV